MEEMEKILSDEVGQEYFNQEITINVLDDLKKKINKEYPDTKKFKKCISINNSNISKKIYKDHKKNMKNIIINEEENYPLSFNLINKDYIVIGYNISNLNGIIIFYNKNDKIKKLMGKGQTKIEIGNYLIVNDGMGGYILNDIETQETNFLTLAENMEADLYEDFESFLNNKEFYEENKITYKRGILLYGCPGNGKTSVIRALLEKYKGVYSFIIDDKVGINENLMNFVNYVSGKDKIKILILEDIDRYDSYYKSALLNIMDGVIKTENYYIISTCNDLSKVDPALLNRPSRFDKIYVIDDPNEKQRKDLLNFYFKEITKEDLEEGIKLTEGFNCAFFKEIFLCSKIHNLNIIESIKYIKKRLELFNIKNKNLYTG